MNIAAIVTEVPWKKLTLPGLNEKDYRPLRVKVIFYQHTLQTSVIDQSITFVIASAMSRARWMLKSYHVVKITEPHI